MYTFTYEISGDKGWPYEVTVGGTTMAESLEAFHRFCEDTHGGAVQEPGPHGPVLGRCQKPRRLLRQ